MNRRGMLQALAGIVVGAPIAAKVLPQIKHGFTEADFIGFLDVVIPPPLRYPSAIAAIQDWKSGRPAPRWINLKIDHATGTIIASRWEPPNA